MSSDYQEGIAEGIHKASKLLEGTAKDFREIVERLKKQPVADYERAVRRSEINRLEEQIALLIGQAQRIRQL